MLGAKIFVAAAFSGLVAAQADTGLPAPWDQCCNLTDPNSVEIGERQSWCQAQYNSCLALCDQQIAENKCDAGTLTYDCQCYQGTTPNISDYAQTLPARQCQAWSGQCTDANAGNVTALAACQNVNCGHKNASQASTDSGSGGSGSSSSSASPSPTSNSSGTSPSSNAETSSAAPSSTGAAVPVGISREASTGLIGAVLFGVFGLFL